jgi:hypothetical protein
MQGYHAAMSTSGSGSDDFGAAAEILEIGPARRGSGGTLLKAVALGLCFGALVTLAVVKASEGVQPARRATRSQVNSPARLMPYIQPATPVLRRPGG